MLSAKYSVHLLTRNFRTAVRHMCKNPYDIGARDGVGTDKKPMKNTCDGSRTFVQRYKIGNGAKYTNNKHSDTPTQGNSRDRTEFPSDVDVCIIGGGAIGSSIAYFLKERAKNELNIVVVEKDKTVILKFISQEKRIKYLFHER